MIKPGALVLCAQNAARSQMAAALSRKVAGKCFGVVALGILVVILVIGYLFNFLM